MSQNGLTRVTFIGDKTVIVAGPLPPELPGVILHTESVPMPGRGSRNATKPQPPAATVESLTTPVLATGRKGS